MLSGNRVSPEEQHQRMQEQQDAEASQRLLKEGGLPLQAKRRLSEETAAGHPFFSSDLSTREFALTRLQGYQPLSQVMGSSIYHIGRRDPYLRSIRGVEVTSYGEVTNLTAAHRHAARLALGRLEEEALLLKAHGVIGMHITCERELEEEERNRLSLWVRFSVVGTAIGTKIGNQVIPKPHPTLSLTDVRPGQYGETRELTIRE